MPEDDGAKTEAPTEKRLQDARGRGQFARSEDLGPVVGLLVAGVLAGSTFPDQARQAALIARHIFSHVGQYELRPENVGALAREAAATMARLCLPALLAFTAAGLLVNAAQAGFRFTPGLLGIKAEKLDPVAGFQRLFSGQGLLKLGLELLKIVVIAAVLHGTVRTVLGDPVFYLPMAPGHLVTFLSDTAGRVFKQAAVGLGLVAAIHYFMQRRKLAKSLLMSRQEVKEDHQASEGDPAVKRARRAMARRLLQKQMFAALATADVIVTNPTHYAVGLRYERGRDRAPVVLAKGRNRLAQRIRALAAEHDVPIVENVAVARALYRDVPVGQPITAPLYRAVAEILSFVYRTHRYYFHRLKARRAALPSP